jgi:predicted aspartyl protease
LHTEMPDKLEQRRFPFSRELRRISQPKISTWSIALRCTTAVVLLLTPSILAFSQPPNRREIPFENSRVFGLVLVKVEVAGKPAVLIVDTGSNRTVISSEIASIPRRTLDNTRTTSRGSGWSGTGVFARATVRIGPVTLHDHPIVVMDMHDLSESLGQRIDGFLGMDFFSELQLVVIDLKNHKLIVEQ